MIKPHYRAGTIGTTIVNLAYTLHCNYNNTSTTTLYMYMYM